jgi:Flp pilus assembly protein TadD
VLLVGAADRSEFERRFPETAGRLHRIQRWPVRGAWVSGVELYRLAPGVSGPAYEATELEQAIADVRAERWSQALARLETLRAASDGAPVPDLLAFEADCLWRLERRAEARARLVAAVDARPFDPVLHTNLGTLAWRDGDPASARRHWMRAVRLDPRNRDVRELLRRTAP